MVSAIPLNITKHIEGESPSILQNILRGIRFVSPTVPGALAPSAPCPCSSRGVLPKCDIKGYASTGIYPYPGYGLRALVHPVHRIKPPIHPKSDVSQRPARVQGTFTQGGTVSKIGASSPRPGTSTSYDLRGRHAHRPGGSLVLVLVLTVFIEETH